MVELKCKNCGYKWDFKGKSDKAECPCCKKWMKTGLPKKQDPDSIVTFFNKAGMNPLKKKNLIGDAIIRIINDDKLLIAMNKYADSVNHSPSWVIRKAVMQLLEKEGYLKQGK